MIKLSDIVRIDGRFQRSVNLSLDLGNYKKTLDYIPTKSSLNIMKKYLENIIKDRDKIFNTAKRANILIGPYGKGKSHLLLIFLELISQLYKKEPKYFDMIMANIEGCDRRAAQMIYKLRDQNIKMLCVILTPSRSDVDKDFNFALKQALEREKIKDLMPDTYYNEAVKVIRLWQEEYPLTLQKMENMLYNSQKIIEELENENDSTLKRFIEIYPSLTSGNIFSPMVHLSAKDNYKEINHKLCSLYGYTGIYIVFDEFSKYIEGHPEEEFAADMHTLQEMCELSANSEEEQLHITFVAHKSIKQYGRSLSIDKQNQFKGIEGRLTELEFVVSAQNNYELIDNAIIKDQQADKFLESSNAAKRLEKSYDLSIFSTLFNREDFNSTVGRGCYPLTPVAAYILLSISERAAQNERTVFTFLTFDEQYSLFGYINSEKSGESMLAGAEHIYDYFKKIFKDEPAESVIHEEWLKAEYALSQVSTNSERAVIKTMALLHMVNNKEELPASRQIIWLAATLREKEFDTAIELLEQEKIITFRKRLGEYTFINNIGIDIENEIKNIETLKFSKINIPEIIKNVFEYKYLLPKKYNQEYKMTRYFSYDFIEADKFTANIKNAEVLFEKIGAHNSFADGKIIGLVSTEPIDSVKVQEHVEKLNDLRLIVLCPKEVMDKDSVSLLKRYKTVKYLQEDENFIENNKILLKELRLYEHDIIFEINEKLKYDFIPENKKCHVYNVLLNHKNYDSRYSFNRLLSKICSEYYNNSPKINNELINRQKLTSQIKKARRRIIDIFLEKKDFSPFLDGNSAEATIFRASLIHTGIISQETSESVTKDEGASLAMEEISEFIKMSCGYQNSFENLYKKLLGRKYGMRRGVIPIYLAYKFYCLDAMPVIYLADKELEITGEIFDNIESQPQDYYLYIEETDSQKEEYIKKIEEMFKQYIRPYEMRRKLYAIVEGMQNWYRGLSLYESTFKSDDELIDSQIKKLRNLLKPADINPRKIIFDEFPKIADTQKKDYELAAKQLRKLKNISDQALNILKDKVIELTKEKLHKNDRDNLMCCIKDWHSSLPDKTKEKLYSTKAANFLKCIDKLNSDKLTQGYEIISIIAKSVIDLYIEDWNDDTFNIYEDELDIILREILENDVSSHNISVDNEKYIKFVGKDGKKKEKYYTETQKSASQIYLENMIKSAIDEFGESLEPSEKVSVLVEMIEKII